MDASDAIRPDAEESFWERIFHQQVEAPSRKKTDYPRKHEFVAWEYTRHNDGSDTLQTGPVRIRPAAQQFEKGLSATRFHNGFQRRMQSSIRQDAARLERQLYKEKLSAVRLGRRRQRLTALDKRNGFNLITGKFDAGNHRCTTPFHIPPRTREAGGLSDVAERSEYLLLRDSEYKFHAPAWSGNNHDARQDLLQREGLNKSKKSTLLGIGGADLASAGAEDMFSKSIYDPAKACAIEGLVEKSRPGRFTPRKMTAHGGPSTSILREESDPSGAVKGSRAPSSSVGMLDTTTVFRVVPAGLGNGTLQVQRARGGGAAAVVPGIAPPKVFSRLLSGSRSAPTLIQTSNAESGREGTNDTNFCATSRLKGLTRPTSSLRDGQTVSVAGGETAPHADWDSSRHSSGGSGSLARRSASVGRLPSSTSGRHCSGCRCHHYSIVKRKSTTAGSTRISPSPAERRQADTLARDVAVVRSLNLPVHP